MTTKSDLVLRSISEIRTLFAEGSFTPHDLLDVILENIKRNEAKVHAYLHVVPEVELRKAADEAESSHRNKTAGLLCGIPLAIKDNTLVSGMPCTGGSRLFDNSSANTDSFAVSKLRKNGAIFLGKTNLDEMAAFGIATNNPHYGRTYNPWNLERIPGGSSGGSAAAVAAGEAFASTGGDTGGSVRIPACFCGLTGLKPTYGRIGRTGTMGMSWSLDHLGVITRTVRDAELLAYVASGQDPGDSTTAGSPALERYSFAETPNLEGIRVGVLSNPIRESDEGVTKAFQQSVDKISTLGASIMDLSLPYMEEITPAIFAIALPEVSTYHEEWLRNTPELYGTILKSYVELGYGILATQYLKAQRLKTVITEEVVKKLQDVDAILTPTAPSVAPGLDQETVTIQNKDYPAFQVLTENTYPFNFLGLPAISIPNGLSQGMPTGLQIVATHWREDILYKVGDALQQVTDFHKKVALI